MVALCLLRDANHHQACRLNPSVIISLQSAAAFRVSDTTDATDAAVHVLFHTAQNSAQVCQHVLNTSSVGSHMISVHLVPGNLQPPLSSAALGSGI